MSAGQGQAGFDDRLVLGIETSCDETAAAVVRGGRLVLSNVVASQHDLHAEYRGVVPEIASRAHAERILPVVQRALADAAVKPDQLQAVAVGNRPGLIGSLLVGVAAAKALAWTLGIPVIGVDHVRAHMFAGCMTLGGPDAAPAVTGMPPFPALGLVVSGGHTSIYLVNGFESVRKLGGTIDDAIGEAYDKVAAMLGLPFPGGPRVDALAAGGNPARFKFPVSRLDKSSLNFSFSGLKTAVLYTIRGVPGDEESTPLVLDSRTVADVCAGFQSAAVRAVVLKLERALEANPGLRSLLAGGGVTANSLLRVELPKFAAGHGLELRMPLMDLCLDNAAMIAGLGHLLLAERLWRGDELTMTAAPTIST